MPEINSEFSNSRWVTEGLPIQIQIPDLIAL